MEIIIELSSAEVACFLRHIDHGSTLGKILLNSAGRPTNAFSCNEAEAFQLLSIARKHCPEAIKRIQPRA